MAMLAFTQQRPKVRKRFGVEGQD
jgi:cytochrome b subunit of formate dehydrogenase